MSSCATSRGRDGRGGVEDVMRWVGEETFPNGRQKRRSSWTALRSRHRAISRKCKLSWVNGRDKVALERRRLVARWSFEDPVRRVHANGARELRKAARPEAAPMNLSVVYTELEIERGRGGTVAVAGRMERLRPEQGRGDLVALDARPATRVAREDGRARVLHAAHRQRHVYFAGDNPSTPSMRPMARSSEDKDRGASR